MHHPRQFSCLLFVAVAGSMSLAADRADASTSCVTDADCGQGLTCQTTGWSGCATPACAKGDECAPAPACTSTEIKTCELAPCATDSDCASGMTCAMSTTTTCDNMGGACSADAACSTPGPSHCISTTSGTCTPNYNLACNVSSDCGSNFTCVADQMCECGASASSGTGSASSSGTGSASGGGGGVAADAASVVSTGPLPAGDAGDVGIVQQPPSYVDAGCSCTPTGTSHCQVNTISCTVDGECPSGWACNMLSVGCACPAIAFADGGAPPCICPDAGSSGTCAPPYWTGGSAYGGGSGSGPLMGAADAGSQVVAPGSGPNSDASVANGSASGAAAPSTPDESKDSAGGGCQVGAASGSKSAASLLATLLLALGVTIGRRRVAPAPRTR